MLLLTTPGAVSDRGLRAEPGGEMQKQSDAFPFRVIQGRITEVNGDRVTVKTPDGFPGGPGIHAQFVTSGPRFEVDTSGSRFLLADGKQIDRQPLAAGDRVVMVLSEPEAVAPAASGGEGQSYRAVIIERVVTGDRMVTH